jgi:hypothetical protein
MDRQRGFSVHTMSRRRPRVRTSLQEKQPESTALTNVAFASHGGGYRSFHPLNFF